MHTIEIFVLVLSFVVLLGIGVPVAWSIGLSTLFTMLVSIPAMPAVSTIAQRMATGLDSFTLLAIPLFILAGEIMNRGGIARRLVDFSKTLVGSLPGGLAHINIIAAMLMGAIAGSAVAAVSGIGGVLGPRMDKEGYPKGFSAAVNITAGTTGLIIPPSNVLIVYSLASGGVSIAALFLAGYLPGILMGLLLMTVAYVWARRYRIPTGERSSLREAARAFVHAFPSLLLLVVVIGGIIGGLFTATEASAVAVLYTLVLVAIYREVTWAGLRDILLKACETTAIVAVLIGASMAMSWVMSYADIPRNVAEALLALSENKYVVLLIINLILLAVGVFMDMTPAVLIFTPIFLPVVRDLGVDPIHFGIIMVLNLCIGLCTPPVGSVLFVGVSVAGTTIQAVLRPMIPLFGAMLVALVLVTLFPSLSLWLPRLLGM
ncbi:MAG: TRAP transporter large permease [Bacteroidia bacterium]